MITTTLNKILEHDPCGQEKESGCGLGKLLSYLGKTETDDEPLSLLTILESNGFDDALWALRSTENYDREIRLFSAWCACESLDFYEKEHPHDMRPRLAIESAMLYAEGEISTSEMAAASDAASDAASAAQKEEFTKMCTQGKQYKISG